ncbi:hypothetical protein JCM17823_17430 [Halorubrum gandharaense]
MNATCADCGAPLDESRGCGECGNDPKRTARKAGLVALVAGVPLFVLQPPFAVVLWAIGVFLIVGAWFLSARSHDF